MLKIITFPNPLLRKKAKPVTKIDRQIQNLVSEMIAFLKTKTEDNRPRGVGLSAPQVGQLQRIIIVWSTASRKFLPLINPKIIWKSRRTRLGISETKNPYEGCLSVPGVWGKVRRYSIVKVAYQTLKNQPVVKKFKDLASIIVQHEIDHLDGILFIDRIIEQKGRLIKQNEI